MLLSNAIESKVNSKSQLMLFSVNAITDGTQAQGEVTMRLSRKGESCKRSRFGS